MGVSIISNNCSGVRLMQDMGMRYDSPTIALQIMPEEFTKFCLNLRHYLSLDITEYTDLSEEHKKYLTNMYGDSITFPVGLCGDIAVCFQHEESFQIAKEKWDRRKARVDYDNLRFLFCLEYDRYKDVAQEFSDAHLENAYIFTRDFDIQGEHTRYHVPDGKNFLEKDKKEQWYFEGGLNRSVWKKY